MNSAERGFAVQDEGAEHEGNEHEISADHEREMAEIEQAIDASIEGMLLGNSKDNEGSEALIYKVDAHGIPQEFRDALQKKGTTFDGGDMAVKMLKLYSPPAGIREYRIHQRAYRLVEAAMREHPGKYAAVPKPTLFRELTISDETARKLKGDGAQISNDRVEVLMMDYVHGQDVATVFYTWILEHHRGALKLDEGSSFADIRDAVAIALDFERPGGKSFREAERIAEERAVNNDNQKRVYDFLVKHGFKMSTDLALQVRNTVELLHANGIYHRDLHERNLMVTDFGLPDQQGYIIDFGRSGMDSSDGENPVDDFEVIRKLDSLNETGDDKQQKEDAELSEEVASKQRQLQSKPKQAEAYAAVSKIADASPERALERAFPSLMSQSETAAYCAVTLKLCEDGRVDRETAKKFTAEKMAEVKVPAVRRVLGWLIQKLDSAT